MIVPDLNFDPDMTGTEPPGEAISTVQICPFGHTQERCRCSLRADYWLSRRDQWRRMDRELLDLLAEDTWYSVTEASKLWDRCRRRTNSALKRLHREYLLERRDAPETPYGYEYHRRA